MDVLVLQHIACEPPALYEEVMRDRGCTLHRVELDEGEPLPDWRSFDAIVAMGGPMSVNDESDHPWLAEEKRAIGEAVRAGTPYFGVCLGVQLLAASLGARVYPGLVPEVGVMPLRLTSDGRDDPVVGALPAELVALQWHSDTFDLPEGAVLLMGSDAYPNQAFRVGRAAYGVQFHLEVDGGLADEWAQIPEYGQAADDVLGPGGLSQLLADLGAHAATLETHARTMFGRWLDLVAG
jgi:GMP synthase-like glutamine amidotransferase